MTALAVGVTERGVIFAADSKRQKTDGTVLMDAQKIYALERGQIKLAFAWAGATGNDAFSLADVTSRVFADNPSVQSKDFASFSDSLISAVYQSVPAAYWCLAHASTKLTYFALGGYVSENDPFVGVYRLDADGVERNYLFPGHSHAAIPIAGSQALWDAAHKALRVSDSLEDMRGHLERYVTACIDDPNVMDCGGSPRTAVVTSSGFKWLLAPSSV